MQKSVAITQNTREDLFSERLLVIVSVIGAVCMLGWLLWYCRYGFDFTDEGFYLNWISHPSSYRVSSSQFGFLYHPLYLLVGGDIAALRQANVLLSFGLGWGASWALLGRTFGVRVLDPIPRLAISAGMATSSLLSLVFAGMWLPTPSYNSLAFQGLLIAASGLILADTRADRASIAGWVLIGVGGWLVFMAKPTSAAALALISALYLLFAGKARLSLLAIAIGTALGLLVLSSLAIDGSIAGFIERLRGGVEVARLLDDSYTFDHIFRLEELLLDEKTKVLLFSVTLTIFGAVFLAKIENVGFVCGRGVMLTGCMFLALLAILQFSPPSQIPGQYRGLLFFAVPFGAGLAGFSVYRFKGLVKIKWSQWVLCSSLLVFPYAYAFGTGNNYWIPIAGGGIFLILSGVSLLGPIAPYVRLPSVLLSLGLAVQVITAALINLGLASPYRQPAPLSQNDVVIEVGRPGSTLVLEKDNARYLSAARGIAGQAGLKRGMPMIDLSGHSPGVVYALGANSVGVAWTLGGYRGSDNFVADGLGYVPCEQLAMAWFLTEPHGPRPISSGILASFGADLGEDFKIVGTLKFPDGQIQQLHKPIRSADAAVAACEEQRKANS
ncbi:hypothetical protein RA280_08285 [Cupriavidus sp. CV2]|uniref:hypothetical protein n=1 Tax=Cupriavidus ulmosensis TaxID=3065913 RepID=UPI00296AB158|nr:hypothetical protein [Cupriavidus sp. CV2]MDW3681746.1 hypothetical protein [Cupriavidus sp. CV2]